MDNITESPETPLRPRWIFQPSGDKHSPETKALLEALDHKLKRTSGVKRQILYSTFKETFIRNEDNMPPPKVSSSGPVLHKDAFNYFAPNTPGVPQEWWGKSRNDYKLSKGVCTSNAEMRLSATAARRHAVRRIVKAVEEAGDEDQRASALFHALNHYKLRNYVGRICRTFHTEAVQVGLQAITGMEELVRMLTQGRDSGGRSK